MTNIEEKFDVGYENLLAGALIRFGKVDENDMTVLIDEFYNMYGVDVTKTHVFNPNIVNVKETYELSGETEKEKFDSRVALDKVQGSKVKAFIGGVSPEMLALRKIELQEGIMKDSVHKYNVDEIVAISKLLNEGSLTLSWNDDCIPNDYEEIVVTQLGRVRLFSMDCTVEIEEFKKLLDENGYDSALIPDFLMAQNFRRGVYEILNLDNFFDFCNTYDRNRYASKSEGSNKGKGYKKVPKDKK